MAIERDAGLIVFLCDAKHCHEICRTEERDFSEALVFMEEEGWSSRRIANEWVHICSDCLEIEHGLVL